MLDLFEGEWAELNWRNVPGPFYGAETDSMHGGRMDAPFHIAYDDEYGDYRGTEFVYRQPVNEQQVADLLNGSIFGHGGYAMDGDDHWTVPEVRRWWRERGRVRSWALTVADRWAGKGDPEYQGHYDDAAQGLRDYVAYIDDGLEQYLRGYLFWLSERREPRRGEALPSLQGA
ncbi:hypothetical protein ACQEU3_13750 [Spirillospora sp. CA-253888]